MKNIFIIIIGLFLCAGANADMGTKKYRTALDNCAKNGARNLENKSSTNDVKRAVLDESNCYVSVGNSVIKEYYSDTITDSGKKFIGFSNSIYLASANVFMGPDMCQPECGQIAETMRMDMTESFIKKYIIDMLDYIDTLDI